MDSNLIDSFELHAFVTELILDRKDWFTRIDAGSSPEDRERHRQELKQDLEEARRLIPRVSSKSPRSPQ
jgi:hypothetical protein